MTGVQTCALPILNRFGPIRGVHNQFEGQKKSERNYSMASQSSSFSTGASSGAAPGLTKLSNSMKKDPHKVSHIQLINAGIRIPAGPSKGLLNTDKMTCAVANEAKGIRSINKKDQKLRQSRSLLERLQFIYQN